MGLGRQSREQRTRVLSALALAGVLLLCHAGAVEEQVCTGEGQGDCSREERAGGDLGAAAKAGMPTPPGARVPTRPPIGGQAEARVGDFVGWTELHMAAQNGRTERVAELLLEGSAEAGSEIDRQTVPEGFTALYVSAEQGQFRTIQTLLHAGANPDITTPTGITPLYVASERGFNAAVDQLLQGGAKVDTQPNPLWIATWHGHSEVVRLLLVWGASLDAATMNGVPPLYVAAERGKEASVKELLKAGADIDQEHREGITALYIAAANGHCDIVKVLVDSGASKQAASNGWRPLDVATQAGNTKCVQHLVDLEMNVIDIKTDL